MSSLTRQGGEGAGGRLASLTALQQSMLLLAESLDSGAIGGQFEQLYRRNQGLAITECHLPANAAKNRRVSVLFKTYFILRKCFFLPPLTLVWIVLNRYRKRFESIGKKFSICSQKCFTTVRSQKNKNYSKFKKNRVPDS